MRSPFANLSFTLTECIRFYCKCYLFFFAFLSRFTRILRCEMSLCGVCFFRCILDFLANFSAMLELKTENLHFHTSIYDVFV